MKIKIVDNDVVYDVTINGKGVNDMKLDEIKASIINILNYFDGRDLPDILETLIKMQKYKFECVSCEHAKASSGYIQTYIKEIEDV